MSKTISIVVPEELKMGLEILAKEERRTFSFFFRDILINELKNSDNEEVRYLVKDLQEEYKNAKSKI